MKIKVIFIILSFLFVKLNQSKHLKDGDDVATKKLYPVSMDLKNQKYFKRNTILRNTFYEKKLKSDNNLNNLREKLFKEKQHLREKLENVFYLKFLARNSSIFRDFLPIRF